MRTIMPSFERHRKEGETIGRLVVGYGELEVGLMTLVAAILDDIDTALKVMFRTRGESQRIQIADALARQKLPEGKFRDRFTEAVSDTHHCLKIRNQYAHCQWLDPPDEGLMFVNMEEIAVASRHIVGSSLKKRLIDAGLLAEQEAYFVFVDDCLTMLCAEWKKEKGRVQYQPFSFPPKAPRPPLYKGQVAPGNQGQAKARELNAQEDPR